MLRLLPLHRLRGYMAGDHLRGPRKDGKLYEMKVISRNPRLMVADGQFSFRLALPLWRNWAKTSEVIHNADDTAVGGSGGGGE